MWVRFGLRRRPVRDPDLNYSLKSVLPQLCLALQGDNPARSALTSERMCICVCVCVCTFTYVCLRFLYLGELLLLQPELGSGSYDISSRLIGAVQKWACTHLHAALKILSFPFFSPFQ